RPSASERPIGQKERRARKREEAERRAERNRRLAPLQAQVRTLEKEIETLEARQRERNLELADPATYDDAARRQELLMAYQADAAKLTELTEAWELAQMDLEALESSLS